jgi:predicted PurR-regulated permease PerM
VLLVVTLLFAALILVVWGLTLQMNHLVEDLPDYRANIRTKIADVRLAGRGSAVEKLQEMLEGIKGDMETSDAPKGTVSQPLIVASNQVTGFLGFAWLGPVVGPLSTAGLVAVMVIFMLLERRDLRDRLIGLIGQGQLATTTKAFDQAGSRVSRQLLMQSLVSLLYGIAVFIGLYVLHVPYPLVWAALGSAFRFIPYIGPVLAAGAPILVSLAVLQGWTGPILVLVLFVVLELFTNLVLEPMLYAGAGLKGMIHDTQRVERIRQAIAKGLKRLSVLEIKIVRESPDLRHQIAQARDHFDYVENELPQCLRWAKM